MDGVTIYVLVVIFVATLIRSVFGFGEALVAVPLLALRLPVKTAAPLAVLMSVTVALIIVLQDWHDVEFRSAGWLLGASVFGIPLGVLLLARGNHRVLTAGLGVIIIAFALHALTRRQVQALAADNLPWLLGCGFCAGVLGGAFGMNGPPLAIYGAMRRWSAQRFRATLQGYFLPASLLGMVGYFLAGLLGREVTRYYLFSLPCAVIAILLGGVLNRKLRGDTFVRYVYAGLVVVGAVLAIQAARG
ncbi:MAG: sulfite exporter TauE/SafE family protein [Candidatus Korobacteraceae bacterium]